MPLYTIIPRVYRKIPRKLGMGLLRVKKDTVADPVILGEEGDPVAQDYEDGVPDDK